MKNVKSDAEQQFRRSVLQKFSKIDAILSDLSFDLTPQDRFHDSLLRLVEVRIQLQDLVGDIGSKFRHPDDD